MILNFFQFSLNEAVEYRKKVFYHGIKKEENVAKILKTGFDLSYINPIWTNDYAISVLTTPKAVTKFFGRNVPIIRIEFEGKIAKMNDIYGIHAKSAQEYTKKVLAEGIDAVELDGNRQFFIYNTSAIKRTTLL